MVNFSLTTYKLTSFNCWFRITFPDYRSQMFSCDTDMLFKTSIFRFNHMTPRRLSIHVCNPEWGVCSKSGALNEDHILAHEIIGSNEILCTLRNCNHPIKHVLLSV